MPTPLHCHVSVIVAARDAGDDLVGLVRGLGRQTLPRESFEVLIADDGSTDGSTGRLDLSVGWLRVLPGPPTNPYAARNRAAAVARGSVLAFCDVDCRPEPDWLERGLAALADADLVGGAILFTRPERKTVWALVDTETFLDQERAVEAGRAVTANLFVHRAVFETQAGFDGSLANGGDHEFVTRCVSAGLRLVYAPDCVVWHPARSTASAFLGKVWRVNRIHGVRESRDDRRPAGTRFLAWLPAVQTLRSRIGGSRPLGLECRRLTASGMHASRWDRIRVVPVIYLVTPYVGAAAQLVGWWHGRSLSAPESAPTEHESDTVASRHD